jgi:hypothetical protein
MAGTAANYLGGALSVVGKVTTLAQVETPDVTSLLTTANTYPTTRPSLNLDFANSATLDPRVTFTRGTNATYTGSDGLIKNTSTINSPRFDWDPVTRECKGLLIEEARTNLWTYSNDFNYDGTRCWQSSILANVTVAPDGTYSADKIIENATSNAHNTSAPPTVVSGTTYTFSAYVKAAERTYASFNMNGNNGAFAGTGVLVNLTAGTVSIAYGTPITYGITDAGNGWKRVYITQIAIANVTGVPSFGPAISGGETYTGDGTSGIYIWGAQFEVGTFPTSYIPSSVTWTGRASTATYVGSNGLIQTAASGVARYQYNPTNLSVAPFLLLEPAATNLYPLGTAALVNTAPPNTIVASTAISSLDSVSIITKHTRDTGTGDSNIGYFATNLLATTVYVGSMYVWIPATTTITGLTLTMDGATSPVAIFADLTIRNQWQRIYVTATTVSAIAYATVLRASGMVTGGYVYSTCYQIETGTYPTSYIPTTGATVTRIADTSTSAQTTRSADVATMTNSNFSSWYNQTEGTMVVNAAVPYPAAYSGYTYMLGSGIDGIYHYRQSDSQSVIRVRVGNTDQFGALGWGVTWGTTAVNKNALTYKLNDFNAVNNNVTPGPSDTSGILPVVNMLTIGSNSSGTNSFINGTIAKLTYYPVRLSNSTLQALTT